MKRSLILLAILVIVLAGTAYTADQPAGSTEAPAALPAGQPAASDGGDKPTTDTPPGQQVAVEEETQRPEVPFGLMIGLYNPTSSQIKDIFGRSNWVRYGLRPFSSGVPNRWVPTYDISYYAMNNDDNDATLIPITVGMIRGYPLNKKTRTYTALNIGMYYANVTVPDLSIDKRGWGYGANATAGIVYKNRLSFEARYELMKKFEGLDFSAFTISAAFKVFTARF